MDPTVQPEYEFFASKAVLVAMGVFGLYAAYIAVQELSSDSLFQYLLGGFNVLILMSILWSGYAMLRYPVLTIHTDHVSRIFSKSASIPFAEVTGIQWQSQWYVSFSTNVPRSHALHLAHLNKADRTQVRNILAVKLNMPELAI